MIPKLFFTASLILLVVSYSALYLEFDNKKERKMTMLHHILGFLSLVCFLAGLFVLYFNDAHRLVIFATFNLFIWLALTGPLLKRMAKSPPLILLHRIAGLISMAVMVAFIFFLV